MNRQTRIFVYALLRIAFWMLFTLIVYIFPLNEWYDYAVTGVAVIRTVMLQEIVQKTLKRVD
jgi:hypothetical protein